MAPKVKVPMNFGRHLLGSPTHNNLTLNTKEGGKVRASSVILSFNSHVIDHMTTTLHMTSVDMLEFSEAAVQVFVDAAYSGTVEGLTKEVFRDFNKIAHVFDVSWLVGKCTEFFIEVVNSVNTPSYTELLYLFEEASFVYETLKSKEYIKVTIKKIEILRFKEEFIEKYLKNVEGVSTGKLDMIIELAGSEVNCVVETLTKQLTELIKIPDSKLPLSCKYLLDNLDLFLLKESNTQLFDRLFSVLGELSDDIENMRWTFSLLQKATKQLSLTAPPKSFGNDLGVKSKLPRSNSTAGISATTTPKNAEMSTKSASLVKSQVGTFPHSEKPCATHPESVLSVTPRASASSIAVPSSSNESRCNFIPNLYHELDMNLTIHGLLDFLETSEEVTSLLMALEALWTWDLWWGIEPTTYSSLINARLKHIVQTRGWSPTSSDTETQLNFKYRFKNLSFVLSSENDEFLDFIVIKNHPINSDPFCCLVNGKLRITFHFAHPSVKTCFLPESCGFILTAPFPNEGLLRKLKLCTKEEDYLNSGVHFHEEVRAEKMHVFLCTKTSTRHEIIPLTWLNSKHHLDGKFTGSDLVTHKIHNLHSSFYTVLYKI